MIEIPYNEENYRLYVDDVDGKALMKEKLVIRKNAKSELIPCVYKDKKYIIIPCFIFNVRNRKFKHLDGDYFNCRRSNLIRLQNRFKIKDDYVIIYMKHKDGFKETIIDLDDFEWIKMEVRRIIYHKSREDNIGSALADTDEGRIALHRLIMNTPPHLEVDHKDRNPLNNRRNNLRNVERFENNQNKVAYKNNKLGVRGVVYDPHKKEYRAAFSIQGKRFFKYCKTLEEAVEWLKEQRPKIMKYSEIDKVNR